MKIEEFINSEYSTFILFILFSFFVVIILHILFKKFEKKLFRIKRTMFFISLYVLIILVGLYFSFHSLESLSSYQSEIDGVFFVLLVLIASLVISRVVNILISRWLKVRKKLERIPQIFSKLVSIIIFIIGLAIIFTYFEVEITPLIATLGIGALAIGLALQSTLANLFAGMHIVSDKPINIGDFIEIDGNTSGIVEDIGWRSTRIKTIRDTIIVVPNAKLADSTIINESQPKREMIILVECGVAYESDLEKVEKITISVAKHIQKTAHGAVKDFEPSIRYRSFGDSNIEFVAVLKVENPIEKYMVKHEFIKALKKRFDKENIEISWPIRKIYQRT